MRRLCSDAAPFGLVFFLALCYSTRAAAQFPDSAAQSQSDVRRYPPEEVSETLKRAGRHLSVIASKLGPSVVHIESMQRSANGTREETGSGVLMSSPRGPGLFVVTNRHVIADARMQAIKIRLSDGRVIHPTEKLEDPDSDLAVLRVDEPGLEPVQFGDSDNLDIGHFVLAMGSPFGLSNSVTLGIISAKGRRSLELPGRRPINQDFLQTDAAINPGNSGGPLIDLNGRVVGINTAIASQGGGNEGIGFSIPSNLVEFVVTQLLEHGKVRRGYLGVELDENFNIETAKRYALSRRQGARVTRVIDKTPAASAGLRADDIILNFDGIDIEDETDLINRVSLTPVKKRVRVIVLRNGQRQTLFIELTERPEQRTSLERLPEPLPREGEFRNTRFSVLPLNASLSTQLGFAETQQGLLVKQAGGSADADSLQLYDVIEEIARRPVRTLDEFETLLEQFADEAMLVIKIRRLVDGQPQTRLVLWER